MAQRWAAGAHRVGTDGSPHASARTSPVADGDILAAAFGAARRAARCTAEEAPRATSRAAAAWAARGARPRVRGRASMSAPPMRGGVRAGMARARRRRSAARTGDLLCTQRGGSSYGDARPPRPPRRHARRKPRISPHEGYTGESGVGWVPWARQARRRLPRRAAAQHWPRATSHTPRQRPRGRPPVAPRARRVLDVLWQRGWGASWAREGAHAGASGKGTN